MFETAELGRKISKDVYKNNVPELRTNLLWVQNELRTRPDFSVIILIAGVDGAGKGETVNTLHEWMDPRYLETHTFGPISQEEGERPPAWRFWRCFPPKGRVGIFFGSWYTQPILDRVYGKATDADLDAALNRINILERALTDDGTLLLKFWFHLSKKAQKKRFKELGKDPNQIWRISKRDKKHFKLYDDFIPVCERALRETGTGAAPWTIVEGSDVPYRELTVGNHILSAISRRLVFSKRKPAKSTPLIKAAKLAGQPTILDKLDLSQHLDPKKYKEQLNKWQGLMNRLSRKAQAKGVSTIAVFEGWDAAGKGGAVRRITAAIDARFYRVIPIAAPSSEELAQHYLWRFWRHLPRAGRLTVFDRSWYGRVLVERVEGYASEEEWMRAYKEINDFEEHLRDHGTALVKFWLHISKEEQLKRFKAREKTSYKKFKITAEDYRNRKRWDQYKEAVNDMVERTSTEFAPWTLVEANDKRHARIKVLKTCCEALEAALALSKNSG